MKKTINDNWVIIAAIFIFAFNVFPSVLNGYSAFTYDNGRDMLAAYQILYEKNLTLIGPTTGIPGVFHGAWCFYWLIIPFLVFGGHPIGVAASIAFINLIGLILFYFLIKELLNKQTAGITALIYASSAHILAHSVQLAHNNLLPFFISLSLFLLNKYLRNKTNKLLFLFSLCIGFLFEFEFGGGLFILLYNFVFISIFLFVKRKSLIDFFRKFTIVAGGVVIPMLPRILFEVRHGFLMTKNLIDNFFHPQIRFYYFRNLSFLDRLFDRLKLFLNLWGDIFPAEIKTTGQILLIVVILILIFMKNDIKKEKSFFFKYTIGLIIAVIIAWIYYKDAIWGTYTSGFPIYFLILLAYAFYVFNIRHKIIFNLLILAVVFLLVMKVIFSSISSDVGEMNDQSAIVNQLNAIDYIYSHEKTNNFSVGVYSPSWFSYPYDYWFLWREKFKGVPRPKSLWSAKINYLIVEPADNEATAKQWFDKFMNKKAKKMSTKYFGRLKVEKWTL